ncbi:hypothetical protein SPI_08926 [Niveomyces insectorum RCEF 264]|uniref:Uncharacterized protein n=1 Tax=Niveomyces insectorum RCEF 264 TaxID=1081102 RepID=A0A167MG15_9HYPO|nr:hypothetical protein SPI_08926 [Niveomyces insectorum RCEF 264]
MECGSQHNTVYGPSQALLSTISINTFLQDTELHAAAAEDEGEGQQRLVVTATLRRTQLDALVALWCCRIWETSAELEPRLHEGMEGVRRKFRLAGDLPS